MKNFRLRLLMLATATSLSATATSPVAFDLASARPPVAEKKPKDVSVHGDTRIDDYFWLREKENPAVLAHLRAENAHTDAVLAPTKPLQEKLYAELLGRIKETDLSVPYRKGNYLYYTRTTQGSQYPIHCRRPASPTDAPEQILLDVNQLAVGEKFMALGHFALSPDSNLLAYSIDRNGHRDYEVRVKNLTTGQLVEESIGTVSSLEWAADNDTLFYIKEEPVSKRAYRLFRTQLSTGKTTQLLEETDELYDLGLSQSLDDQFIFLTAESKTTTEVRALPAAQPTAEFRLLLPRQEDHEYHVDHSDGLFYIVTNLGAKNFRIVTAPVAQPDPAHWTEFLPHNPAVKIDAIELFRHHAVVTERENGLPQLRVIDLRDQKQHRITFPEPVYDLDSDANAEPDTLTFRFRYQSPVTPNTTIEYHLDTRERTTLKQQEIPSGYDAAKYACERVTATAADGTQIPLSLVYRRDLRTPGKPQPLFLYGYGSYGISIPDSFSTSRLSLLDRGVIYAIAHIRGGGELGETWRDAGKMKYKMNTFTDFIACAEHLVKNKITAPEKLVINGGSAGGLLMGAVVNLRPELFRAAIYDVPFVDVLNTMLDETLPLTTSEYLEWGNPTIKEQYDWIRAYSPYDNVRKAAYPAILMNTSLNDSQVPYWEAAKLTAKLRAHKTDANPLLLRVNLDAGHGGASGRYDSLRELALDYAFALTALGL